MSDRLMLLDSASVYFTNVTYSRRGLCPTLQGER